MQTVSGLFDTLDEAKAAVTALEDAGIAWDDISLVSPEGTEIEADNETAEGVGVGATVGAIGGLLAGLGAAFIVPGIGAVVGAGWLAAALAGAVAGGGAGGVIGALIGAGVPSMRPMSMPRALSTAASWSAYGSTTTSATWQPPFWRRSCAGRPPRSLCRCRLDPLRRDLSSALPFPFFSCPEGRANVPGLAAGTKSPRPGSFGSKSLN